MNNVPVIASYGLQNRDTAAALIKYVPATWAAVYGMLRMPEKQRAANQVVPGFELEFEGKYFQLSGPNERALALTSYRSAAAIRFHAAMDRAPKIRYEHIRGLRDVVGQLVKDGYCGKVWFSTSAHQDPSNSAEFLIHRPEGNRVMLRSLPGHEEELEQLILGCKNLGLRRLRH